MIRSDWDHIWPDGDLDLGALTTKINHFIGVLNCIEFDEAVYEILYMDTDGRIQAHTG